MPSTARDKIVRQLRAVWFWKTQISTPSIIKYRIFILFALGLKLFKYNITNPTANNI